jgi:hypothetical protein
VTASTTTLNSTADYKVKIIGRLSLFNGANFFAGLTNSRLDRSGHLAIISGRLALIGRQRVWLPYILLWLSSIPKGWFSANTLRINPIAPNTIQYRQIQQNTAMEGVWPVSAQV